MEIQSLKKSLYLKPFLIMKYQYKNFIICFISMLCFNGLSAQQVSFTNMGSNLGTTTGSSYEDCAVDMNGDYLDDIVRVTDNRIYIDYQQTDGSFAQGDFPMNLQNYPSWSICAGDIDNNGFNDLLFGGGSRVSFIYANADGTAYTEDFHDDYIFSQRSTFADIDNDGNLDAFVCHDVDQSHPYRNNGAGVLVEDQSLIQTLNLAGNYAAIWVDYDNDWDTDMYLTKCRQGSTPGDIERTNAMYRNNGDGTYTEVGALIGMADNAQSWATAFEDFDNDGDFDAFIVNHDDQNRFMINDGAGNFTESIMSTGIDANDLGAWENASADFNNDGYMDILSELGNELYLNNGDMTFTGYDLPFDDGGIGDFNNDGFLDIIRGDALWMNDANGNNWVKINTQGIVSNRNGIGARVEIHGAWGVQIREVRAGQSFSPMSSLAIHFGIGTATAIDAIVIKWPSGMQTTLENPAINSTHNIPEAECLLASSTISVTGATEFCEGSSVQLMAPAGFANYDWSNGATTQSITVTESGNYNVVMEDNNDCISLSNSVVTSIIAEAAPIISLQGDNVACAEDQVTLTVDSGTNPVWSNGQTGQSITITESGTYSVQTEGECSGQSLASESIDLVIFAAETPVVEDVVITEPAPVTLTSTGDGDNLFWFDSPVGGNEIGTGNTYDIALLEADLTVYVESRLQEGGALQDGGKLDDSGNGGLPSTGGYNYFNAFEPFTILKVTVYVPETAAAGDRTIQLVDTDDNVLEEIVVNLNNGQHELDLNFEVPEGMGYSLRCPENTLFRNNDGVNYPYPIGDVGELTTSLYGGNWYYYFYDWKIEKEKIECISDRVEANASINTVSTSELEGLLTGFTTFPNPAQDEVNISFDALENMDMTVELYDMTGREVRAMKAFSVNAGTQVKNIKLTDLAKGIYYIQLSTNGRSIQQKIIVQ
jgi:hypothetical protein